MTFTDTGGGDHAGEDWTPTTATYAGIHYNIGTFTCGGGVTMTVSTGVALEVYANTISVVGTIDGNAKGSAGGNGGGPTSNGAAGSGACGGSGGVDSTPYWGGGGGGGYGGVGGAGSEATTAAGGGVCGLGTYINIDAGAGSGGGGGAGGNIAGAAGGRGGGWVTLVANTVTVTGIIQVSAGDGGANGSNSGAGGGGAAGMVLIIACTATIGAGTFTGIGGTGGTNGNPGAGDGGGGGGARIKVFYNTLSDGGVTTTLTGGAAGGDAIAGSVGAYTTTQLAQCTSSIPIGGTFNLSTTGIMGIETVKLWCLASSVSGDFTLGIYDGIAKAVQYGTDATTTVSSTGEITFTFDPVVIIPDGTATVYMELNGVTTADARFAVYGISEVSGGSFHKDAKPAARFELYQKIYTLGQVVSPTVHNTADTTTVSNVANTMLIGAVHRINTDGTGTFAYADDFSTNKFEIDSTQSGVTHDTANDELDIADGGYLYYPIDSKYPIVGVPVLTAQIDITDGAPTIQISDDDATWHDIDTAVVDDVETVYPLDSAGNLVLDGESVFYFRIDCGGAGTNTCSIKTFALSGNMTTADAEHPVISTGAANTFQCDQDAASSMNCAVETIFNHRKWMA